jgi:hypothetical protein
VEVNLSALLGIILKMTAPLWAFIGTHPWLSATICAAASALCFALDIPYLRVIFGAAVGAILIAKSERDYRREKVVSATSV